MIADPPFDEESLREIEQALGTALPEYYRQLLLAFPFVPEADRAYRELFDDKTAITEENRLCREGGFFGQKWPDHWLIIGGDGTGGNYFLDLTRRPPPVLYADHERTAHSESNRARRYRTKRCSLDRGDKAGRSRGVSLGAKTRPGDGCLGAGAETKNRRAKGK